MTQLGGSARENEREKEKGEGENLFAVSSIHSSVQAAVRPSIYSQAQAQAGFGSPKCEAAASKVAQMLPTFDRSQAGAISMPS